MRHLPLLFKKVNMKSSTSINKFILKLLLLILIIDNISCSKVIEIPPPTTSYNAQNVFTNDVSAISVLTGLYADMSSSSYSGLTSGSRSISVFTGLSSDELTLFSGITDDIYIAYYKNQLSANDQPSGSEFWGELYTKIFICNAAIEGLTSSTSLTPAVNKQLLGEAKFMRSFFYFYLVNLFGEVPLITTTDYNVNSLLGRNSKSDVYRQIIVDLIDAKSLLAVEYLDSHLNTYSSNQQKVRPNKWTATALLARAYLYNEEFSKAEAESTEIIASSTYTLSDLNSIFLANSTEAIWQLQPVNNGKNTEDAFVYIIPEFGLSESNPVYLSSHFVRQFEQSDGRWAGWVDTAVIATDTFYYPSKYKSATYGAL